MAYWMINNVVAKRPSTERVPVLGKKREREKEREGGEIERGAERDNEKEKETRFLTL